MRETLFKNATWLSLLLVLSARACFGQESIVPKPLSAAVAIEALQDSHLADGNTFVVQSELDFLIDKDGGGACASAAAIDALQVLRKMAGLDTLSNPHKIALRAFATDKALLKGRVTNDQFVALLKSYADYLPDRELAIEVVSAPNSPYTRNGSRWGAEGPDLILVPGRLTVLSFTVTEADGTVAGRHFVLLQRQAEDELVVLNPTAPAQDHSYYVDIEPADAGSPSHVFLRLPKDIPARGRTFELNTIFTVSLSDRAERQSDIPTSLEGIKARITKTASDLRGSDDFLSPKAWRRRTAVFGLPGLDLPVEYGGAGWKAVDVIEVFRHAGQYNLNFRDVVGGAHVRPLLSSKAPEVLDVVRQVAKGEAYVAIAITEPTAGSDITAIKSTSRKVDGGYLLTGTKRFNARLNQATHVILFTQGTTGVEGELSVFVLPIDTPGLKVETLTAHGLTGNSYGGVSFKDVFVPEAYRIGEDGKGMSVFFKHFLYWRLMQTAAAIGTGEDALRQMAERIKKREAFGGPIGRFTHLQQPIGQYTTELRMAYALVKHAAERIDRDDYGGETRALICGLKAEGVEVSLAAVDAAMRAFGGEGYSTSVDLGDRHRDLNGLRIADGTTDVMRMEVVRWTFGKEFWEMAVESKGN